ncbi:MAG TPA: inorganic phosphate transporter [Chitinophagales bacterium]|nr:inorganic phosphate transporter [Chitinophagales bacterium]
MDDIYLLMIIALVFLAIADLVVGVSNDAVNFLNSAVGSKALTFRTILIIASVGLMFGAVFSDGMMEVARKGIFNPGEFVFAEVMIIFIAVILADILLLEFFNILGMPTSTTVSIVFNLVGASFCIALIKISGTDGETFASLSKYINFAKCGEIIMGIISSVVIAFGFGLLVQFITRLFFTFDYTSRPTWMKSIFGGIALSSILYFILLKGIKSTSFAQIHYEFLGGRNINEYISHYSFAIIVICIILFFSFSFIYTQVLKLNIFKLIIGVGTFALALAFAGNDLVNFIGVPMAGYQSYELWKASGQAADSFNMSGLAGNVPANHILLILSGTIMALTIWFNKRARFVMETELKLTSQEATKERFNANFLSRATVRLAQAMSRGLNQITPSFIQEKVSHSFIRPSIIPSKDKSQELPSFDMVRASTNLMMAGILISIATSYKLPLSTTYVTFMVAMGTSLADRAWGADSAVYRVAGVFNVIGSWFMTALGAFIFSMTIAYLIYLGGSLMIAILIFFTIIFLLKDFITKRKNNLDIIAEDVLIQSEKKSIQGVLEESSNNIKSVFNRTSKIFKITIEGLENHDVKRLEKNRKGIDKLGDEIEELQDNLFYFIKNMDETTLRASNLYINILSYLEDIKQSLDDITKSSYKHINNKHARLKEEQIKELNELEAILSDLLIKVKNAFKAQDFPSLKDIYRTKKETLKSIDYKINAQVDRTRNEDESPKNARLYFSILLETKTLVDAVYNLVEVSYDSVKERKM